jgi:sugar phosphate isomerase/epimerase
MRTKEKTLLSVSSIAWDASQDQEVAELLVSRDIRRVDLAPSKYEPWDSERLVTTMSSKRAFWEDHGIEIVGFQSLLFGLPQLNIFQKEDHAALNRHFERVFDAASAAGARKLVFGSPQNRRRGGLDFDQAEVLAIEFFFRLALKIGDRDIQLLIEPNPESYGCDFITSTESAFNLVQEINHPKVLVNLDLGTCMVNDEDPIDLLKTGKEYVGYVHLSTENLAVLAKLPNSKILDFLESGQALEMAIEQKASPEGIAGISRSLDWLGVD